MVKFMDGLPKIVKVILALPGLDFIWNVYRLVKSLKKGNILGIVLGILLLFVGWAIMWIVDIVTLILNNKVIWID